MTGNDIRAPNYTLVLVHCILLIFGALMSGNVLGTVASIFGQMNRKQLKFQSKLDLANTSMMNMKIPEEIQSVVRDFFNSSESTLSN